MVHEFIKLVFVAISVIGKALVIQKVKPISKQSTTLR